MARRWLGLGMAAAVALAGGPLAAKTPKREEIAATVKAQHEATLQALRDWVALPTIAAEKKNTPQGAEYMRKLALDAGFQQAKVIPTQRRARGLRDA